MRSSDTPSRRIILALLRSVSTEVVSSMGQRDSSRGSSSGERRMSFNRKPTFSSRRARFRSLGIMRRTAARGANNGFLLVVVVVVVAVAVDDVVVAGLLSWST